MLLSTWEPTETEDRRTFNLSWPFRCSEESMTEQFGSGFHVMLHSDEFFLRILIITEPIGASVISKGRI